MMLASVDQFFSPEGVTSLVALLGLIASVVVSVLNVLGKKDAAAKVAQISLVLKGSEKKLEKAISVVSTVIKGVEVARSGLSTEDSKKVVSAIKQIATNSGVEQVLNPIVKSVTENKLPISDILAQ